MGSMQGDTEGCFGVVEVKDAPGLQDKTMHLLPCGTNYTGPAPVQDYFKITAAGTNEDGIEMKEAAFRGRKLMGSTLLLPDGFCGFVLKKDIGLKPEHGTALKVKSPDEEAFDVWEADSMFGDFTYWNHDTLPSKADHIRSVMEWLPVSAAGSSVPESQESLASFHWDIVTDLHCNNWQLHEEVTADDVAAMTEKMKTQSGPSLLTGPFSGSKRKL